MKEQRNEYWKITKELYEKVPNVPELTESNLMLPSFRIIQELIKCIMRSTTFADGLFLEEELDNSKYSSNEDEIKFLERLLSFLQIFEKKKLSYDAEILLKSSKDIHEVLQLFYRCAVSGIPSIEAVHDTQKIPFLPKRTEFLFETPKKVVEDPKGSSAKKIKKIERFDGSQEIERLKKLHENYKKEEVNNSERIKILTKEIGNLNAKIKGCTEDADELKEMKKNKFNISFWDKKKGAIRNIINQKREESKAKDKEIENCQAKLNSGKDEMSALRDNTASSYIAKLEIINTDLKKKIEVYQSNNSSEEAGKYKELKSKNEKIRESINTIKNRDLIQLNELIKSVNQESDSISAENQRILKEIESLGSNKNSEIVIKKVEQLPKAEDSKIAKPTENLGKVEIDEAQYLSSFEKETPEKQST